MPVTSPISLSKIAAEFGGEARASRFLRGGVVPNTSANQNVSTTANGWRMSTFLNASNASPPTHMVGTWTGLYEGTNNIYAFNGSRLIQPGGGDGTYTYAISGISSSTNVTSANVYTGTQGTAPVLYVSGSIATGNLINVEGWVTFTFSITSAGLTSTVTATHHVHYTRSGGVGGVSTIIL